MSLTPARRHYVLIFILSLSLLMLEIATARILSVVLLSHYAFVAVCADDPDLIVACVVGDGEGGGRGGRLDQAGGDLPRLGGGAAGGLADIGGGPHGTVGGVLGRTATRRPRRTIRSCSLTLCTISSFSRAGSAPKSRLG